MYIKNFFLKKNANISLFLKNINKKYKLIPFNVIKSDTGITRYFPAATKEWNNSIYYYNNNIIKNLPVEWSRKSHEWAKLPNSGNSLKLMVPNYSWKAISGWINHSCKVISHMLIEKEIGNRGSKSVIPFVGNVIVKEQRVNGSWCINSIHLRCTLMDFERNYQVKILSNQINKRSYSINASSENMSQIKLIRDPWFLTGLAKVVFQLVYIEIRNLKEDDKFNLILKLL